MDKLRIAMVLNSPGLGGVPEVVRALVSRLAPERFEPSVFMLKPGDPVGLKAFHDIGIEPDIADTSGGKIAVISQLANWLTERKISILHTHSYRPNLYGRMAGAICRPNGLRIVSHYHNLYEEKWRAEPHALTLERRLADVTDAQIAVSDAARNHIAEITGSAPDRINVIRNGVDLPKFDQGSRCDGRQRLGLAESDFAIGLVGRICHQKGQDIFFRAARVLTDHPDMRFFMIGDEEDTALAQILHGEIAAAGLGHRIHLTGHIADTAPVMAALDLLVAPSRWEGFPLVLLEAMAAKTPVIATRAGGIPELTDDGAAAFLVPFENPEALAKAIASFARDSHLRSSFIDAGYQRARVLSWDTASQHLSKLYDALFPESAR